MDKKKQYVNLHTYNIPLYQFFLSRIAKTRTDTMLIAFFEKILSISSMFTFGISIFFFAICIKFDTVNFINS